MILVHFCTCSQFPSITVDKPGLSLCFESPVALRLVFTSDGVVVGAVIRSEE